jgi:hypothetical protein
MKHSFIEIVDDLLFHCLGRPLYEKAITSMEPSFFGRQKNQIWNNKYYVAHEVVVLQSIDKSVKK